ncbi:DUF4249 domain-containing protein [Polaribacter sp. MSW13]|uniref:DUF4249 domain-containing protein n=1 Tax=Polaribacter marinus TaxID=2916838 RepID=A0A9X1VLK6_9FLAO|nr:DUF4249 family protein [Polaribacter marinus]MCI2227767.1 DUF4249 domain-containing protein [Polaribacter marinus]
MKKSYIISVLIIIFFSNCEKVIDIDVPSTEPRLVIDASFEILFNENPVVANTIVKLSLSADYFDDDIPPVTNADVFLTNLSNNTIITFSDGNSDGNYEPTTSFIPADDITYELTVIYENQIYKGKATKVKSTPFTSVIQGDETLFSGKETEIKITFKDPPIVENYYLFDFDKNLFLAIDDRYFNGSNYNFSFFYQEDDIELPTTVNIKMSGVTKEFYTYFEVLISQSGQNSGGPFQSAPSSLLGNMINTTNEVNFPLGYFHISETDTYSLNLIEKD